MKEMTEAIILALKANIINKTEAKELFLKACQEWFNSDEKIHIYHEESN